MPSETPICDFGVKAPDFSLEGTDGKRHCFADVRGPNGTVIVFICNHCPYVIAIAGRLADEANALSDQGIGIAAIMSNNAAAYPADSFENMKVFAERHRFGFPYLFDPTQDVAHSYGAVCTPDFFGFNACDELQYRGRLDASKTTLVPDARRELYEAMVQIAATGEGPADQIPSMGCSIKWRI